ncbi:MAG: glycosyltransferase family 2 protein [Leptospiraceae bacterium]|nr:glycosyltransferase family 2 protein [Leptospiraceae bacterium]
MPAKKKKSVGTKNNENSLKVSLIIPIYNEEGHLQEFLEKLDKLELPIPKELIFIDDCSKDNSLSILKNFPFQSENKIIENEKNRGKGAALRTGFENATGDFVGVQDADFEYDMYELPIVLESLILDKADIVYGSRFRKENRQVHRTFHYLVNRFLTLLSNFSSGLYLSDMETCYKFFKREIIQNIQLESNRFGFEPEITAKIARLKARVREVPISYYPKNYMEGKKITWKDGVAALRHIIVFNFFKSPKKYLKKELPEKYIPHGGNWL